MALTSGVLNVSANCIDRHLKKRAREIRGAVMGDFENLGPQLDFVSLVLAR